MLASALLNPRLVSRAWFTKVEVLTPQWSKVRCLKIHFSPRPLTMMISSIASSTHRGNRTFHFEWIIKPLLQPRGRTLLCSAHGKGAN
jgi:hypothetical protein